MKTEQLLLSLRDQSRTVASLTEQVARFEEECAGRYDPMEPKGQYGAALRRMLEAERREWEKLLAAADGLLAGSSTARQRLVATQYYTLGATDLQIADTLHVSEKAVSEVRRRWLRALPEEVSLP